MLIGEWIKLICISDKKWHKILTAEADDMIRLIVHKYVAGIYQRSKSLTFSVMMARLSVNVIENQKFEKVKVNLDIEV